MNISFYCRYWKEPQALEQSQETLALILTVAALNSMRMHLPCDQGFPCQFCLMSR